MFANQSKMSVGAKLSANMAALAYGRGPGGGPSSQLVPLSKKQAKVNYYREEGMDIPSSPVDEDEGDRSFKSIIVGPLVPSKKPVSPKRKAHDYYEDFEQEEEARGEKEAAERASASSSASSTKLTTQRAVDIAVKIKESVDKELAGCKEKRRTGPKKGKRTKSSLRGHAADVLLEHTGKQPRVRDTEKIARAYRKKHPKPEDGGRPDQRGNGAKKGVTMTRYTKAESAALVRLCTENRENWSGNDAVWQFVPQLLYDECPRDVVQWPLRTVRALKNKFAAMVNK